MATNSFDDIYEEFNKSFNSGPIFDNFRGTYTNSWFDQRQSFYGFPGGPQGREKGDQEVIDRCEKDAIEYFPSLGLNLVSKRQRQMLSKENKERVVGFLKARLQYYQVNGFVN